MQAPVQADVQTSTFFSSVRRRLRDAATPRQAQTFLSRENFCETHPLTIPGPKDWRFAYRPHVFSSLPFILGVFLFDFAFSLQLCFIINYKYSFQIMCFQKQYHPDKLNLKVFTHIQKL